ncbi:MAG: hypothetical protein ACREFQ_11040, partial [Stellaceae bacterium]
MDEDESLAHAIDPVRCDPAEKILSLGRAYQGNDSGLLLLLRRLCGEARAADAHSAFGILPETLACVETAESAGDALKIVRREAFADIGVIERLLFDQREDLLGQIHDAGFGGRAAGPVRLSAHIIGDPRAIGIGIG